MEMTPRQNEIVKTSIRIIARQGMQDLTIKNIAAAIGVTEAALYRHFKSKNEILLAILEYFREIANCILKQVGEEGSGPLEKMESFILNRYRLFASDSDLAKVMFSEVLFENDEALSQLMLSIIHEHMQQFFGFVEQAQNQHLIREDIEKQHLFRMIVGSMRLLVTQWTLSSFSFSLEEEGKRLWEGIKLAIQQDCRKITSKEVV